MRDLAIDSELPQTIENFDPARLCSKVGDYSWIGSVQGAVATWSVISIRGFLAILDCHGLKIHSTWISRVFDNEVAIIGVRVGILGF
jgi:hypothetical protein